MKLGNAIKQTKTLIALVKSDQARNELRELTEGLEEFTVKIKQTEDVIANGRSLVNGSADVVIVEADALDPSHQLLMAELCRYISKDGVMVVISPEPSVQTVRDLFKIGVSDVMPLPLNPEDFYKSIKAASDGFKNQNIPQARNGKIIAIAKSSGGVGSTTVTLNLARQIMKSKQFLTPNGKEPSVAVFDFNIQFGAAALNLNLVNKANLLTVLEAESRIDADLLRASVLKHESGLEILAAPQEIVPGSAFSKEFIEGLLDLARTIYDVIVIDMPLMWTGWTPLVYQQADVIIPVLLPQVAHVHTMTKFTEGLVRLDVDMEKTFLVLNQVGKGAYYKPWIDQVTKRFKRPICVRRKNENLHITCSDRGVLLEKVGGNKIAMKEFDQISERIHVIISDPLPTYLSQSNTGEINQNYAGANL